ncbi:hypothetical protein ANN_12990 [Periplaneta americana]|uniref:Uncharacterized protein n=1 Tax=Periplaneta americana TaxID=6978 RepID=A0ABQ8TKU7_PERAM|nr:hypothetical protein ANN_12990 [Periplaneta americana]
MAGLLKTWLLGKLKSAGGWEERRAASGVKFVAVLRANVPISPTPTDILHPLPATPILTSERRQNGAVVTSKRRHHRIARAGPEDDQQHRENSEMWSRGKEKAPILFEPYSQLLISLDVTRGQNYAYEYCAEISQLMLASTPGFDSRTARVLCSTSLKALKSASTKGKCALKVVHRGGRPHARNQACHPLQLKRNLIPSQTDGRPTLPQTTCE